MSSKPAWDPLTDEADAIVVGTGPGGATVGHGLAAAGRRVLFCELGGGDGALALRGQYPELAGGRSGAVLGPHDAAVLRQAGRYSDTLLDMQHTQQRAFVPFIGSGPGGSSALYGMAMERLMARDFDGPENDAARISLLPALAEHGAQMLAGVSA